MTIQISTLKNGLRIVTSAIPLLETAAVSLSVDTGSRFETAADNGVAHMLEHMVFKGTTRRTARQIAEEIESVGGHLNAYTSRDQTTFYARVLGEDVALGLDMIADLVTDPVIDAGELEKEKDVVLQELGTALDTPDDIIFDHLQQMAYPDQPIGRSILGTQDTIRAITREAIFAYRDTHYLAGSMVLSAAGKVAHDDLVHWAEEKLGRIPAGKRTAPVAAAYQPGVLHDARDLEQAHLTLALPAATYADPTHYAQTLFSALLGGGMSSRLFQEIREERGLAYAIYSYLTPFSDTGLFAIYMGTSAEQAGKALDVTLDCLLAATEHIDEAELSRAKAQAKAGLFMSLESCSAQSENLARQLLIYDRIIPTAEIVARIDSCSVADVIAAGRAIISGGKFAAASIGPASVAPDIAKLSARLQ
jgi:predicted Zn-dependent peptidase